MSRSYRPKWYRKSFGILKKPRLPRHYHRRSRGSCLVFFTAISLPFVLGASMLIKLIAGKV